MRLQNSNGQADDGIQTEPRRDLQLTITPADGKKLAGAGKDKENKNADNPMVC